MLSLLSTSIFFLSKKNYTLICRLIRSERIRKKSCPQIQIQTLMDILIENSSKGSSYVKLIIKLNLIKKKKKFLVRIICVIFLE